MSIIQLRGIYKANQFTLRHQWILVEHGSGITMVAGKCILLLALAATSLAMTTSNCGDIAELEEQLRSFKKQQEENQITRQLILEKIASLERELEPEEGQLRIYLLLIILFIYLNVLSLNWNLNLFRHKQLLTVTDGLSCQIPSHCVFYIYFIIAPLNSHIYFL